MSNSVNSAEQLCLFCSMPSGRVIAADSLVYAIRDGFPVTTGHSLVIPKRHVDDFFGLTEDELIACSRMLRTLRQSIVAEDSSVEGFNIGMNAGTAAGQTVFHCHIHLIPRRYGDVQDPRGGVRGVIPGRAVYAGPPELPVGR
jgi:ATP adenylyltransferase